MGLQLLSGRFTVNLDFPHGRSQRGSKIQIQTALGNLNPGEGACADNKMGNLRNPKVAGG
jgi:hypothetical protein